MAWLAESGEILVLLRYLRMAGAKDFGLCRSAEEFLQILDRASVGTEVVVFRGRRLPLRGAVTDAFIELALAEIPDGVEHLVLSAERLPGSALSSHGVVSDRRVDLQDALKDLFGEEVAVGVCHDFVAAENEEWIAIAKGGIDGPR